MMRALSLRAVSGGLKAGHGAPLYTAERFDGVRTGNGECGVYGACTKGKGSLPGWRRPAALVLAAVLASILLVGSEARAEDVAVPIALEAPLLAKVAAYDRSFVDRAAGSAKILLLVKPGNAQSSRTAAEMQRELGSLPQVAGLSHEETVALYTDAASLKAVCERDHIAIVFFGPGFADDIEAIRVALDGVDVLTATAVPDYVPKGIVLGFDLVSGKPKLVVHLSQARRQHVSFSSSVLKLMRVYE
jgi:hypothetical protein